MGEIGGKHGYGGGGVGVRLECDGVVGVKLVGAFLSGVHGVVCKLRLLKRIVEGVGDGGCAGTTHSSDVCVGVKVGAEGDGVHALADESESMSIVDGVGVGGCAGSAQSSVVLVDITVGCVGGVVGLLVAGVCVEVVGEDR